MNQKLQLFKSVLQNRLHNAGGDESAKIILAAMGIGISTGLGAVIFIRLLKGMADLRSLVQGWFGDITGIILIMGLAGLVVGFLVERYAREAKGHGVPEVMEAIALKGGRIRPRVAAVKVFASALTIGAGGSAGREGPIVQVGSALGSSLGQLLRFSPGQLQALVACGAAAGIAATFNAPIAGAIFALEVILRKLDTRNFVAVVISAVSAGIIGRIYLGERPAFDVPAYSLSHLGELPIYLVLGVLSALMAVLFIRLLYYIEGLFDNWEIPLAIKASIGMLLTAGVAFFLEGRQVLGPGLDFIGEAISQDFQMSLGLLLGLLILKLLATSFTLGSGNSGGVFAPALFMGAILGGLVGQIANQMFPDIAVHPGAFAIVGMAAVFSGAARAPLTGILIVFEMSNDYRLILPLMLGTVVSTLLAELLFEESIYTLKLKLRGIRLPEQHDIDIMQGVTVGEAMSQVRETASPDMSLSELAEVFERCHHHGLPVTDQHGELLGVVSVQDLTEALPIDENNQKRVIDIATLENVQVAYADEPMWMALRRLGAGEISVVPVVDRETSRKLVGVVRRRNVVHAYNQAIARHANFQHRNEALSLGKLDGAGFYQIEIGTDSPVCGRKVNSIALPEECLLVSIRRKRKLRAIHGDTVLQAGDHLTLFAHEDSIGLIRDKFTNVESSDEIVRDQVLQERIPLPSSSQWIGHPVGELAFPPNCILAKIRRNGQVIEASPDVLITAGDTLEVIGTERDIEQVIAMLKGNA